MLRGQRTTANKNLRRPLRIERKDILVSRVCRVGCVQTSPISFNLRIPFSTCNKGIGTLRSDTGKANENVTEKLTSRSLKLFRRYTKSPIYFKIRKLGWNWREGTAFEFRESITLPFPLSSQLKIWSFHVVVVAGTAEKCTKKRAELSFFSFRFPRRRRRNFLRSLIGPYETTTQNNTSARASRIFVHFIAVPAQLRREITKFWVDLRTGTARR